MNNLKYAIVEDETAAVTAEEQAKPFLVSNGREQLGEPVTSRVEAILDFQFAQGSMPA